MKTFINAKKLYFSVRSPVSLFVCSIIASIIFGLDNVANIVNPAIRNPRVVIPKLKPISAHFLRSFRSNASLSTNTNAFTPRHNIVAKTVKTCNLLGNILRDSLYTCQRDFSLVSSESLNEYFIV